MNTLLRVWTHLESLRGEIRIKPLERASTVLHPLPTQVLARKVPHTESLKDCMDRTIPYFKTVIEPAVLDKKRNVRAGQQKGEGTPEYSYPRRGEHFLRAPSRHCFRTKTPLT